VALAEEAIPKREPSIFGALKFRDFRLLWGGLLVSNLGTWMQFTASGYFIVKLAGTPEAGSFYVGLLGAARMIPVVLLSPIAGVVADTLPRRRVLFVTNAAISVLALLLAVLTTLHHINIWGLIGISMMNAAAQSFDAPARQSWVPLMVDREYVGNAIGLNSIAFNAPAVVGPAVAGLLIVSVGVAGSFYANAIATLAVIAALLFMKPSPPSSKAREPMLTAIQYGLKFLFDHRILKYIILFFTISALLVRPYSMLLPAYALNYLHTDALGLSWAISAQGIGAFGGALVVAVLGSRERRGLLWIASLFLMAVGVAVLGFITSLYVALPVLVLIGLATMTFMGSSNILIQTLSPDNVRGRAISVYSMIALGIVPAGSFIVGALGSLIGLHLAFIICAGVTALMILWLWITKPVLKTV
jgi:MFS family permease